MYCSELVYKAYLAAGITLVELRTFQDYELSSEPVQEAIRQRWGEAFDATALVVGPADLMVSELLEPVGGLP